MTCRYLRAKFFFGALLRFEFPGFYSTYDAADMLRAWLPLRTVVGETQNDPLSSEAHDMAKALRENTAVCKTSG